MAKKSKNRKIDRSQNADPKIPWYKRVWFIAAATSTVVTTVLIQGPTMLQNARILPNEIQKTSDQFHSWVKEDSEWTGHWSSFPEGMVDMADMNLSDVDLQITIWAKNGRIDGTIATKKICQSIPVLDYVLLRGEVSGNKAEVIAWDIVGGHKKEFASLTLVRDGYLMTVAPKAGMTSWFPQSAKIARRPRDNEDPKPDSTFCAKEKQALYDEFNKKEHG